MRGFMGYMLIGMLAVLAMGLTTTYGLGLASDARPMQERTIIQHVDRTHKADRLDMRIRAWPTAKEDKAISVGCEPAFSTLSVGDPIIPGRCVS